MKNNFYKISMLIEGLLVAIVAIFLLTNSPSSNHHFIEIPYVHPYEFYLVLLSGSILFAASILIAAFLNLFAKHKGKTDGLNDQEIRKIKLKENFWKLSFFAGLIISFLIICFTLYTYITLESSMILYQTHKFNYYAIPILVGHFIISLFLGAVFLSAGGIWLQNKALAIIVITVGLCFLISPLGYITYVKNSWYNDLITANYYNQFEEEVTTKEEEVEAAIAITTEEVEEHYDMGEEYEEGEEYFSFSGLWDDPSDDEDHVKSAIEAITYSIFQEDEINYLGSMRHYYDPGRHVEEMEQNTPYAHFKKIKERILKHPDILQGAFNNYKYLLYQAVPIKSFIRNDGDIIIELLLLSYYDIQSDEDPDLTLDTIFKIMTSHPKNEHNYEDDASDYFEEIKVVVSEKMMQKYNTMRYGMKYNVSAGDVVWAYSFWARRNKEGNTQVIFDILNEVKRHYDE